MGEYITKFKLDLYFVILVLDRTVESISVTLSGNIKKIYIHDPK